MVTEQREGLVLSGGSRTSLSGAELGRQKHASFKNMWTKPASSGNGVE